MYRLNDESRLFLSRGYLSEGQTAEERIRQIADNAERILGISGFSDKFYDYMSKGYYSLATPIWTNFGNNRGLNISCYCISIEDSITDIMKCAGELGVMSKLGGGVGAYFGNIRPRGSSIKNNGESSGSVHFMELFDKTADTISQGSCYVEGTLVLTNNGFKDFREIEKEDKLAQVDENNAITFTDDYSLIKEKFSGNIQKYSGIKREGGFSLDVTPDHRMVVMRRKGTGDHKYRPQYTEICSSKDLNLHRDNRLYISGKIIDEGGSLSPEERLMVAFQADGRKTPKTHKMSFHFQKKRKIERLIKILEDCGFDYKMYITKQLSTRIDITGANHLKIENFADWVNLEKIDLSWGLDFINEVSKRDGTDYGTHKTYSSTNKECIRFLQSLCPILGLRANLRIQEQRKECHKDRYVLGISNNQYRGGESIKKDEYDYKGNVYCASVPTGMLVVMYNDNVTICGNSRRGFTSPYLPVTHSDIEEFLKIGNEGNAIQRSTTGVVIPEGWMDSMLEGDTEKRYLWIKILEQRALKGHPYIMFQDNVHTGMPQVYKDKGMTIDSSNICCVTPETKILTNKGYEAIGSLCDTNISIWNGEKFTTTTVRKTGENNPIIKVVTDSGQTLECTTYHKFYVMEKVSKWKYKVVCKQSKDLLIGDKLIKFNLPIIQGNKELEHSYDNGFYSGDGCYSEGKQIVYLYHDKMKLKDNISSITKRNIDNKNKRLIGKTNLLKEKYFVPNSEYTVNSRLSWLSGIMDADGTVLYNNDCQCYTLQLGNTNIKMLENIQLMLQTLGCKSKIKLIHQAGLNMLPKNDGTGEHGEYYTKDCYRLLINSFDLDKLIDLGFKCNRLLFNKSNPNRDCESFIQVKEILDEGRVSDTYCFTEEQRGMGMFNGILTGNSEICLNIDEMHSFVCCLSSLNLLHRDEIKNTDAIETMIYFLDANITEFLEKLEKLDKDTFEFMKKAYNFAKRERAIGMGVLGRHHYLQSNMIAFDSDEACRRNIEIFREIQAQSNQATEQLAIRFGEPELLKGYGRRNSTCLAIAPTTSSSFILGQVSQSIEPFFGNIFTKDTAKTKKTYTNPMFVKLLEEKELNTEDMWKNIIKHDGSIQHLDMFSQLEKDVFKTFAEIDQGIIIQQGADRQKYIDQSQSLNIMVTSTMSPKEINRLHVDAWKKGIKTLYYQHSQSASQQKAKQIKSQFQCFGCES